MYIYSYIYIYIYIHVRIYVYLLIVNGFWLTDQGFCLLHTVAAPRPPKRHLSRFEGTGFDCESGHVAPLGRSHAPGTTPLPGYLAQKKTPDPPRTPSGP